MAHSVQIETAHASVVGTIHLACDYVRRGLATGARARGLFLGITLAYAAPALLAAFLVATTPDLAPWQGVVVAVFPWITASVGPVVIMVAVGRTMKGKSVTFLRASWEGWRWLPRYLWTNAHTSLIFWVPVGALLELRRLHAGSIAPDDSVGLILAWLWWPASACVALVAHTRTVLAPFLAVHEDLPATLATLEAWRLSGRYFGLCLTTFVMGCLPVTLPLGVVGLAALVFLDGPARAAFLATAPHLFLAGVQLVRPVLIPALYALQGDLWRAELARRAEVGSPSTPPPARLLLALTAPLPKFGRPVTGDA